AAIDTPLSEMDFWFSYRSRCSNSGGLSELHQDSVWRFWRNAAFGNYHRSDPCLSEDATLARRRLDHQPRMSTHSANAQAHWTLGRDCPRLSTVVIAQGKSPPARRMADNISEGGNGLL